MFGFNAVFTRKKKRSYIPFLQLGRWKVCQLFGTRWVGVLKKGNLRQVSVIFVCEWWSLLAALLTASRTLSLNSVFQVSLIKSVSLMQISVTWRNGNFAKCEPVAQRKWGFSPCNQNNYLQYHSCIEAQLSRKTKSYPSDGQRFEF